MMCPRLLLRLAIPLTLSGVGLVGCGDPPPLPIEMALSEDVDKEVKMLVDETLSKVRESMEDTSLRVDLALIYEANQLWYEASLAWEQALQLQAEAGVGQDGATRGVQLYHHALCARQAGEIALAATLLKQAVESAPTLAAAHHELAETHLEIGELDLAEAHFQAAAKFNPQSSDPYVGMALVHLGREEAADAEQDARRGLAIEPTLKRAHYALGLALRGQGRLEEAERELTLGLGGKARNLGDPLSGRLQEFKKGYHSRVSEAISFVNAGNPAMAVRLLEPILLTHPDDEALLNNLAVAYTHLRQHNKAREVLLKVIELEPTSFPAYINLTAAELELGMNAQAMQHSEAAVRYAPEVAKTRFVRARSYMRYRRWNEAYADLKKTVQIQGEDAIHHIFLGEVCQELGMHVEALSSYETALRLDETAQYVWIELGFSAAALGDFRKATDAYQKALRLRGAADARVQQLGRMINGG
jgi:tetratricopeptide (TPR) repeat protein